MDTTVPAPAPAASVPKETDEDVAKRLSHELNVTGRARKAPAPSYVPAPIKPGLDPERLKQLRRRQRDKERAVKDAAKAAAKASKPKPVNEPALPRIPAPTRTPTSPKPPRQKQKLPRLPPRGVSRRDDAASKLRGAWASGVRSLRDGVLHIRAGAVHIGTATARSASSVGKRVHDAGHAID